MQAAEVARPYLLGQPCGLDFTAAVATVAVEWVLDRLAVLVLFVPARIYRPRRVDPAGRRVPGGSRWSCWPSWRGLAALRWMPRRAEPGVAWIDGPAVVPAACAAPRGHV